MAAFHVLVARGGKPTIYIVNLFLKHYTFAPKPDLPAIIKMMQLVQEHEIEPDVFTFTMILKALIAVESKGAVEKLIRIMNSTNVRPNTTTYGLIINNLARSDRVQDLNAAMDLLDEMENTGMATNEIIYTSLIQGFLRASAISPSSLAPEGIPPLFLAAITLKKRMEVDRKLTLNRIGYNALISAGLSLRSPIGIDIALRSFDVLRTRKPMNEGAEAKGAGVADTWYVLLDGFAQMGDWSRARRLVEEMGRGGFVVKSKALTKLVDQIKRGGERR